MDVMQATAKERGNSWLRTNSFNLLCEWTGYSLNLYSHQQTDRREILLTTQTYIHDIRSKRCPSTKWKLIHYATSSSVLRLIIILTHNDTAQYPLKRTNKGYAPCAGRHEEHAAPTQQGLVRPRCLTTYRKTSGARQPNYQPKPWSLSWANDLKNALFWLTLD